MLEEAGESQDRRRAIAFVTMGSWGGAYGRIARWLAAGFQTLDIRFDEVHLDGPARIRTDGAVRTVFLGATRARWTFWKLARYFNQARPSVTFVQPAGIALMTLLVGKVMGQSVIPWESTVASLDVQDLPRRLRAYPRLQRIAYRWAPFIAAVSEDVRRDLLRNLGERVPPERVVVVPNPVDVSEIRTQSHPVAPGAKGIRLCTVGRLASQKGIDVLLRALAGVNEAFMDWELIVVGDGPLKRDLQQLARSDGIADKVQFVGWMENPYPLMASCDVFVHPARWEGHPLALTEAMALDLPIIATTCPGAGRELLRDGALGILVPPNDHRALAREILRLSTHGDLRERLRAQVREGIQAYSPERVARQLLSLAQRMDGEDKGAGAA